MAPEIARGGTYFLVSCVNSEMYQSLLTGAMRSWSQHQKCKRSSYFLVMSLFMLQSDATAILVMAPGMQEFLFSVYINVYVCILTSKSVLQSSTELAHVGYICIVVLCTSHCVVLYNVPPLMGQVLGKVLLTSWEIS